MRLDNRSAAHAFCEAWIPEFTKSVAMFTGNEVTVEDLTRGTAALPEGNFWQGQILTRNGSGTVWIGISLYAVGKITGSLAEDAPGQTATFRELLRQSFEGAAHILSGGETPRMVCTSAIEDGSQPAVFSQSASATIVLPDGERMALCLVFDAAFEALLTAPSIAETTSSEPSSGEVSIGLDRLVDLELPMTVVIGRSKVSIRAAIKLAAGSLIELDRRGNEPVEVVIHNAVVARGEVVSVDGSYGVRITEVMSRRDRVNLQSAVAYISGTARRGRS